MRIEVDAPNTKNKGEIPPFYYAFILSQICEGEQWGCDVLLYSSGQAGSYKANTLFYLTK